MHREQLDAWKEAVNETFFPLRVDAAESSRFSWRLHTGFIGSLQVTRADADPELVVRTPRLAASDDNDHYLIALQIRGSCRFRQDGRDVEITPGDFTIYDCTRPFDVQWNGRHRTIVAMFDRSSLELRPDEVSRVTSTPVSGAAGTPALVRSMLGQLSRDPEAYQGLSANRVASTFLDLVSAVYSDRMESETAHSDAAARTLLIRVKAYIEDHLYDPELSVESIAAAHYVSVRYLHRLFEGEQMTTARWIRHLRLEQCRRDLVDPLQATRSVSEIAARNGILNASHFSQMFRSEYGESPKDHRRRALEAYARIAHSRRSEG
ncbi:AraC-like ligand-binding domain-containing protein [Gordonia sp. NPDC003425]